MYFLKVFIFLLLVQFLVIVDAESVIGRIPMKVSVNPRGSSAIEIPIDVPMTTVHLKPAISIAYHSSKSQTNGILGTGFYLKGLSNIHPCPRTIFNDEFVEGIQLDDDDRFCLDGERMVKVTETENGETHFTTQRNTMTKIVKSATSSENSGEIFTLYRSDGVKMYYGARKTDTTGAVVIAYGRTKVEDPLGNYYELNFDEDYRLANIQLTKNTHQKSNGAYAQVSFAYENRHDVSQTFIGGVANRPRTTRLSAITVTSEGKTKITYSLKYTTSCSSGASQLLSITKCGSDKKCLPPTTFDYDQNCEPKFSESEFSDFPFQLSTVQNMAQLDQSRVKAGSFGGKTGLTDFYVIEGYGDQKTYDSLYLRNDDGTFEKKKGLLTTIRGLIPDAQFDIGRYKFTDFTGNGYLDIYMVSDEKSGCAYDTVYINDGKGGFSKTLQGPKTCISSDLQLAKLDLERFRFADFTGNGKPDLYVIKGDSGPEVDDLFLLIDDQWKRVDGIESSVQIRTQAVDMRRLQCIDLNGDGKTDIHYINAPMGGTGNDTIYVSEFDVTGAKTTFKALPTGPITSLSATLDWAVIDLARIKYGDFNGDGLTDIYVQKGRGPDPVEDVIYLNHGEGVFSETKGLSTRVSAILAQASLDIMSLKTMSLNNDRLTDIYVVNSNDFQAAKDTIYLGQGVGKDGPTFKAFPGPATIIPKSLPIAKIALSSFQFVEIEGSGYNDLVFLQQGKNPRLFKNDFRDPILTKATDGFGEFTSFEFTPLTDGTIYQFSEPSYGVFPVRLVSTSMRIVSKMKKDDGIGGELVTKYDYEDAKYHMHGLGFLGFGQVTQTNEETGISKVLQFDQDYETFLYPQLTSVKTYTKEKVLIHEEAMTFQSKKSGNPKVDTAPIYSVYSSQKITSEYDQFGNWLSSATTKYKYDTYWNLIQKDESFKDSFGVHEVLSTMEFAQNLDKWIMNMQTSHSLTYSSSGPAYLTEKSFKQISFKRDTNTGLVLSKTEHPSDSSLCKTTENTHDTFGNVISKKKYACSDPKNVVESHVDFEPLGRYITKETDAKGFTKSYTVDPMYGVNLVSKDELGIPTYRTLDSLGRLEKKKTFANTITTTLSWCPKVVPNAVYCSTETSTTGEKMMTVYDRLGREIMKSISGLNKNIMQYAEYDTLGNRVGESAPHFDGDTGPILWHRNKFDVFGRIVKSTDINGHVATWSYKNSSVTHTNPAKQVTITTKNSRNRVVRRIDAAQSSTTYKFDSRLNLVETTDPKGNQIQYTYDLYNRKVTEVDPNAGKISYAYDWRGNILSKIFNNGDEIKMKYDVLNRMTTRSITGESDASFVYDQQYPGTMSSFSFSSDNSFSRVLKYDKYGRLIGSATTFEDFKEQFLIGLEYDQRNRLVKKTYPNGVGVCYVYNEFGYKTTITNCSSTTSTYYQQILDINAFVSVLHKRFGNGLDMKYNHMNDNKLIGINTNSPTSGAIQNLVYHYDPIGRLLNRSDVSKALFETFSYDELNRVTGSNVHSSSIYSTTFKYDVLGNMLQKSDVGHYFYGNGKGGLPHAVTKICEDEAEKNCYELKYDAKGNMIGSLGPDTRTISYNVENKPTKISSSRKRSDGVLLSVLLEFSYDPFGKRFRRRDQSATSQTETYYIGGDYEIVQENSRLLEKVYITESIIHESYKNDSLAQTDVLYVLRDHIYSVDVITDQNGAIIKEESYDAFGRARDAQTWMPLGEGMNQTTDYPILRNGFTNQEELWLTGGLIHMNGRLYDSHIGRFLSCDPFVQQILDLQNLNRYSYAFNNPLVITDPSGYHGGFFHHLFHAIGHLFHSIGKIFKKVWNDIKKVVETKIFEEIIKIVIQAVGLILSPFTGGASLLICEGLDAVYTGLCVELNGGSFTQALEAAVITFAEEVVTHEVGSFFSGASDTLETLVEKSLVHGVMGAGEAELHHQSPLSGFISGFAGTLLAGDALPKDMGLHLNSWEMEVYGGVKTGVLGGISSWASGHGFMNGALSAEKGYLIDEAEKYGQVAWKYVITPSKMVGKFHVGSLSVDYSLSKSLLKDSKGDVTGAIAKFSGDLSWKIGGITLNVNAHGFFESTQHGLQFSCDGTWSAFEKETFFGHTFSGHQHHKFHFKKNYDPAKKLKKKLGV